MGQLILRCPKTGGEFDSGFALEPSEHHEIPRTLQWRLRCKSCREVHEFRLVDGRIGERLSASRGLVLPVSTPNRERRSGAPRYPAMDIGFTITILLLVFIIATAIGFAWTGLCRQAMNNSSTGRNVWPVGSTVHKRLFIVGHRFRPSADCEACG